ncbi:MAG: hypothetical protein ACI8WY_003126, partial [Planctomycetota bacterium]
MTLRRSSPRSYDFSAAEALLLQTGSPRPMAEYQAARRICLAASPCALALDLAKW